MPDNIKLRDAVRMFEGYNEAFFKTLEEAKADNKYLHYFRLNIQDPECFGMNDGSFRTPKDSDENI